MPVCDAIVGPGSKFVTAAKSLVHVLAFKRNSSYCSHLQVAGSVAIDMLAGPSECLVLADDTADPKVPCSHVILASLTQLLS